MSAIQISTPTQSLLDYLPSMFNKTPPSKAIGGGITSGIPFPIYTGASNVFSTMDTVGFVLNNFLNDTQSAKQEAYVGYIPVQIGDIPTGGAIFPGFLEDSSLPGFIFNCNQTTPIQTLSIPLPRNINGNFYVTIVNIGISAFTIHGVFLTQGSSAVFNFLPGGAPPTWIQTTSLNAVATIGADTTFLNNVGTSYGVLRTPEEGDDLYRSRIRAQVVGNKVTIQGIGYQIKVVFGFTPAIYDWFPTDYQTMLSTLTANFCAFDVNGNPYTLATQDTNYPINGNPFNFYVVLPASILTANTSGVFAGADNGSVLPSSFYDWQDPQIGVDHFGGFYNANPGEIATSSLSTNKKILQLLQSMKAAGTNPILVLQNCE